MFDITRRSALLQLGGATFFLATPAEAETLPLKQWFLYRETGRDPHALRSGRFTRLANNQLVAQLRWDGKNPPVGGIYWGWISRKGDNRSEGNPQVRFYRAFEDANAGDRPLPSQFIQTNEAIALRFASDRHGPGHLLYKRKASDYHLAWQKRSQYNPRSRTPDIYQWEIRNSGRRSSDHRKRDVKEETVYSLYNTVAKRYLIAVPKKGAPLKWEKGR